MGYALCHVEERSADSQTHLYRNARSRAGRVVSRYLLSAAETTTRLFQREFPPAKRADSASARFAIGGSERHGRDVE